MPAQRPGAGAGYLSLNLNPKWPFWVKAPPPQPTIIAGTTFNQALDATAVVVTASLATATTFARTLTATSVAVTASMMRQVNKILTGTAVVVTGAMVRQVSKFLSATVPATGVMVKRVSKTLAASAVAVLADLVAVFIAGGGVTIITKFFGAPSPSGPMGEGTPGSSSYAGASPGGAMGGGTPSASEFDDPSPGTGHP